MPSSEISDFTAIKKASSTYFTVEIGFLKLRKGKSINFADLISNNKNKSDGLLHTGTLRRVPTNSRVFFPRFVIVREG